MRIVENRNYYSFKVGDIVKTSLSTVLGWQTSFAYPKNESETPCVFLNSELFLVIEVVGDGLKQFINGIKVLAQSSARTAWISTEFLEVVIPRCETH